MTLQSPAGVLQAVRRPLDASVSSILVSETNSRSLDTCLIFHGRLDVPGLAENRPSVLVGDIVCVRHTDTVENIWHEGIVHEIGATTVQLRFDNKFSVYKGTRFDVRFVLNRMPLRRMHQAVTSPNNPERILFPSTVHAGNHAIPAANQIRDINLVNRKVDGDDEQYQTVLALLNRPPGNIPFVLFGPYVCPYLLPHFNRRVRFSVTALELARH